MAATAPEIVADFSCAACGDVFATAADQRMHCKSERHVYNTKRKMAGLRPITQEAWERKLREKGGRAAPAEKGTAHLKAKKNVKAETGDDQTPSSDAAPKAVVDEEPPSPRRCLFDRRRFDTVEECVTYMEKTYSFFVPDQEYCTDLPGFLTFLHCKLAEPPHLCLKCNCRFPDANSVRRHMLDKGHTQIGSEIYTRRGNYSEAGTNELQAEMEPYYDFRSSVREVAEKLVQEPAQKVASILRFFDADKDGRLSRAEVGEMWKAIMDGGKLSEAQYLGACSMCGADAEEGIDTDALSKLYADGFADLDEHFKMLQDLLVQRQKLKMQQLDSIQEGADEETAADDDDDESEEDEDDSEGSEEDDDEGSSDEEVVECEDEDEFEEVMRILGLQPVSILPTGDLRLPNGTIAAHRDVSYIWRQRGVRMDQNQLALSASAKRAKSIRCPLMLSNAPGSGCLKIAVSQRQQAKEGKKIIAILRERQNYEMRLGMRHNVLQTKMRTKIRTGRGDMSAGR